MKRILMSILLSMAFLGMMRAQDGAREWLKRYKIDPLNSNPVFTRPTHENDEARVMGAGICMNDGLAYNCRYYNFGEDWHYAPKLSLCKQEEDAFSRVTGAYIYKDDRMFISNVGQILKYGVIPTEFGAIVAYRVWGQSSDEPVRHYYATFDHEGNLLDAFYAGHRDWMNEILKAEPHGNYTPRENFGGGSMQFSEDNKTLTKTDYYYFKTADNKGDKWDDTTVFSISDKGLFSMISHAQNGKPEVNSIAEELYSLETLPLSDQSAIKKWNAFYRKNKNNVAIKDRLSDDILRLFISRQQEYMAWTTANKAESVLIGALKPALERLASYCGSGSAQMLVVKGLEDCPDSTVKNYWKNLKSIRSVLNGEL